MELRADNVARAERHVLRVLELVEAKEPENKVRLQRTLTSISKYVLVRSYNSTSGGR